MLLNEFEWKLKNSFLLMDKSMNDCANASVTKRYHLRQAMSVSG